MVFCRVLNPQAKTNFPVGAHLGVRPLGGPTRRWAITQLGD